MMLLKLETLLQVGCDYFTGFQSNPIDFTPFYGAVTIFVFEEEEESHEVTRWIEPPVTISNYFFVPNYARNG